MEKTRVTIDGTVYQKVEERPSRNNPKYSDTFLLVFQDTGDRHGTTLQVNASVDQIQEVEIGDDVTIQAVLDGRLYSKDGQESAFIKLDLDSIEIHVPIIDDKPKESKKLDQNFGNAGASVDEQDIPF